MNGGIPVGVDLGSTGPRVVCLEGNGTPIVLDQTVAADVPWLLCEPSRESPIGICFPSVKGKLGIAASVPVDRQSRDPAEIATEALRAVRETVTRRLSRPAARLVVSVPASYASPQRAALRTSALAAGFPEVHLINDSVAAAIAHTPGSGPPATLLVYGMGYSGFEAGLVRAPRGHYRALGYEGGTSLAGHTLDLRLLGAVFDALEENRLVVDTRSWDWAMWLRVRAAAARLKEELSERAHFPIVIETSRGRVRDRVLFDRRVIEEVWKPAFTATVESAAALLPAASLSASDVDAVLLVGGSTRMPLLERLVEKGLGQKPIRLSPPDLALGAALYAQRLGAQAVDIVADHDRSPHVASPEAVPFLPPTVRAAIAEEEPARDPPDYPTILARPAELTTNQSGQDDPLGRARHLLADGHGGDARDLLTNLSCDAQALLQSIPAAVMAPPDAVPPAFALSAASPPTAILPAATPSTDRARQALAEAERFLAARDGRKRFGSPMQPGTPVPNSPDTFEKMIDIHRRAAASATGLNAPVDGERWLFCAYSHDESNSRLRKLLADRHYHEAKRLFDQGKRKHALRIIELCTNWDPEHRQARDLQTAISRRRLR